VVATGTPEDIAACPDSYTGQALKAGPLARRRSNGRVGGNGQARKAAAAERLTHISVQGAQQHNLKDISVEIPREQMTVCSGPSGSGKSSLALDTIYAEGQRRYVESLSSYARQFLGQVQKPKVESVSGLSPAISIEQKTTSKSPRSTVGTVTEVYDYLRILYARLGQPYCPFCQIPIGTQTADEIIDKIMALTEGTRLYLMAPVERRGQGSYESLWEEVRRLGFLRMRVDGQSFDVQEPPSIDHRRKHQVEVIVDRILVRHSQRSRLADSVEAALDLGRGVLHVAFVDTDKPETDWKVERFSQHFACDNCGRSYEPLTPHHFSFNSPLGWCPSCEGLGFQSGANPAVLIRDPQLTLRQGAVAAWPSLEDGRPFTRFAEALARHAGFSLDTPYEKLEPQHQRAILNGTGEDWIVLEDRGSKIEERRSKLEDRRSKKSKRSGDTRSSIRDPRSAIRFQYKGLMPAIDEASRVSFVYRHRLDSIVSEVPCPTCGGSRLRADAAACRFQGNTLGELCHWPLDRTAQFFKDLQLDVVGQQVAGELLREIRNRVQFLVDVGLDYLTLARRTPTLSGGESQRIRLASQIGSGLTGVLYVLDEPTIGLHPRDNRRLLAALNHLRDLGNSLLLVEHDREVIGAADYLLDFGPGAGINGGEITAQGTPKQVQRSSRSLTGQYLSGKKAIPVPSNRRIPAGAEISQFLEVRGARHHNLKNINVRFPLGCFLTVTGVSGSGKSSLVNEILYNALARRLHRARTVVGAHDDIVGLEHIDKVINVDQDPIGNSPSSNPATYTGVFDLIRQLFAQLPESKIRGYQAKRFSFNKPGGRCEACEGNGQKKIEMHFLPDVWVECEVCHGTRYNPETLAVRYKSKSIADVLQMSVAEALELFANLPKIRRILQTLADVGLDYISLGQAAPTLSGGEAQRVKLAAELSRPNTGRTVYLLDEPTTGLHFDDIRKLLDVLNRLVDLGNTVIVVEHNLDVIKTADWVIDLGPEAGDAGGQVVAEGAPEQIIFAPQSHTGAILADVLAAGPLAVREKYDPTRAEEQQAGDHDIAAVGEEARMPWEADGRKWHTSDRVSHQGKPCHWEGATLDWIDKEIHSLGKFSDTNWNHRSVIEIADAVKSRGWFFHGMTGQEWYVRLAFRVGRNTFKQEELNRRLGLPTFNEMKGVEYYSSEPRVHVANRKGPWQEVAILAYSLKEIDTAPFKKFLKEAVQSFKDNVARTLLKPEDVMPWKVNGERWHLGEKGFPIGKKVLWERSLLPQLLDLVRQVEPGVQFKWDTRDSITLYAPGIKHGWARWWTKRHDRLECQFFGKKGQFNLKQIEKFGHHPRINNERSSADIIHLHFQRQEHLHPAELKEFMAEHLNGFREIGG
jgi:excinuclease ABC subunit A